MGTRGYFLIVLAVFFVAQNCFSELNVSLVKVRMQKDLTVFPKIPGSFIKKINENVWNLRGRGLVINNKLLPQNNFITKKENGNYDIISVLEFNEYLAGVLASEMPVGWPLEALKAQAVVARSYALARIKERKNKEFHLESDQTDQVFTVSNILKAKQAVSETAGVVLLDSTGSVLKAYYHSDCGGETVLASEVWGADAIDTGTAKDPWCAQKKSNHWTFEMSKTEFSNKLANLDLDAESVYFKRRMQSIKLGDFNFSIQKLREIFGFYKIRSSANSVEIKNELIKISGQGFGHGVGLCQWGTLAQVKLGINYLKIIEHYYPKAQILLEPNSLSLNSNLPKNSVSN